MRRELGHEGVLDAFGHVSARHPRDPGRYLLSRSRAPELVEPPREPPKNWRQRWTEVKQATSGTTAALPRVMRLVWQASPGLTVALFVVTALSGLMPAASAYTAKLLINAVVAGINVHANHLPDRGVLRGAIGPFGFHSPVLTTTGVIVLIAPFSSPWRRSPPCLAPFATSRSSCSRSWCRCASS